MKPSTLNWKDPIYKWLRGCVDEERDTLLATIELACDIKHACPNFVELGTFMGDNARNFILSLNKLNKNCRFFSVDYNPWNHRLKFYPKEEWGKRCQNLTGSCVQHFLEGKTVDHADSFEDGSIVWLFVDACHCFECVRDEINLYSPKVVPGGYMLFHDTTQPQNQQWVTHNPPKPYGVLKAINQSTILKEQFSLIYETKKHNGTQVWRKIK